MANNRGGGDPGLQNKGDYTVFAEMFPGHTGAPALK